MQVCNESFIMMRARSIRPHKLRKIETSSDIHGGIHMFSHNISVTSRATHFAVSVPAQEFHFSPAPQLYKYRNENLVSRLNTKYFHIYTHIYILLYQSYPRVNTSYIYI